MVEQRTCNALVGGSIPPVGSIKKDVSMCIKSDKERKALLLSKADARPFLGWKLLRVMDESLLTPFTDYPVSWDVSTVSSHNPMHLFLTKQGAMYGATCMTLDSLYLSCRHFIVAPVTFEADALLDVGPWDEPNGVATATVSKLTYFPIPKDLVLERMAADDVVVWLPAPRHTFQEVSPDMCGDNAQEWVNSFIGFSLKPLPIS